MIAALFVETGGIYAREGVDLWDITRDARKYAGPWPVVAHPPCERWGRYAEGGPNPRARRFRIGDDNGCFAAALSAVRAFGGVLEHPEGSKAWRAFGLAAPERHMGWTAADFMGGATCVVDQGHFGHPAAKATWLYAVGCKLPSLPWDKCFGRPRLDEGWHSTEERRAARARGVAPTKRLTRQQRVWTPPAFAELLLSMAHSVARSEAA